MLAKELSGSAAEKKDPKRQNGENISLGVPGFYFLALIMFNAENW